MMHELLLALRGYPGGLFVGGGLQVSPEPPPFLHPSEAALLARVCRLGALYVRLQEFIEQFAEHAAPPLPPAAGPPQELLASPPGIYLRAFCTGLDAVLQPYRQALLGLEQEFLADPHLTISYVNYSLDQIRSVVLTDSSAATQHGAGQRAARTGRQPDGGRIPQSGSPSSPLASAGQDELGRPKDEGQERCLGS